MLIASVRGEPLNTNVKIVTSQSSICTNATKSRRTACKKEKKMVLYYLNDRVIEMMLTSDDDFVHRLAQDKLTGYATRLQGALDSAGQDPQGRASIGPVLEDLLSYCLNRKTSRVLWFVDFSSSGLMCQLTRVIEMIPEGYAANIAGMRVEEWPWIHALVRELLIPECRKHYTAAHDGYSLQNHSAWAVLYGIYDLEYSFVDLSEDFGRQFKRADEWSNHLAIKVEEGDEYRRVEDPWYSEKYAEWESIHDPHRDARVHARNAQHEYDWAIMNDDEREEYHSDESCFEEEVLSTDGEDSDWSVGDE